MHRSNDKATSRATVFAYISHSKKLNEILTSIGIGIGIGRNFHYLRVIIVFCQEPFSDVRIEQNVEVLSPQGWLEKGLGSAEPSAILGGGLTCPA